MSRNEKKYLFDISQAIANIFTYHLEGIKDEMGFEDAITSQRAIEREMGIIGEAAYQLRKLGLNLKDHDKLINRRNTLVHQYDVIRHGTLWQYVQLELPDLKKEVDALLAD